MIEAHGLTKRYGPKLAVDDLSFCVRPGQVTGFLGPNGAGKSTTMRMIVGLDRPTNGQVRVNGKRYESLPSPLTEVGILLDAKAMHTGRSAYSHLHSLAATHGIGKKRVNEVIELTGLSSVAKKRVGGFSLGMGQRLGIAVALLGDPHTLILDEPVNGLDPEGVIWVRNLVRHYASQGRTVFLSSHLMSEMAQTADHIIVLGRGRLLADAPVSQFINASGGAVRVRSPRLVELAEQLTAAGATVTANDGALMVQGMDITAIGDLAARFGFPLHELVALTSTLEQAYMDLTAQSVEFHTGGAGQAPGGAAQLPGPAMPVGNPAPTNAAPNPPNPIATPPAGGPR